MTLLGLDIGFVFAVSGALVVVIVLGGYSAGMLDDVISCKACICLVALGLAMMVLPLWDACDVGEDLADHRNAAKLESERVVDSVAILEGSVNREDGIYRAKQILSDGGVKDRSFDDVDNVIFYEIDDLDDRRAELVEHVVTYDDGLKVFYSWWWPNASRIALTPGTEDVVGSSWRVYLTKDEIEELK